MPEGAPRRIPARENQPGTSIGAVQIAVGVPGVAGEPDAIEVPLGVAIPVLAHLDTQTAATGNARRLDTTSPRSVPAPRVEGPACRSVLTRTG